MTARWKPVPVLRSRVDLRLRHARQRDVHVGRGEELPADRKRTAGLKHRIRLAHRYFVAHSISELRRSVERSGGRGHADGSGGSRVVASPLSIGLALPLHREVGMLACIHPPPAAQKHGRGEPCVQSVLEMCGAPLLTRNGAPDHMCAIMHSTTRESFGVFIPS